MFVDATINGSLTACYWYTEMQFFLYNDFVSSNLGKLPWSY